MHDIRELLDAPPPPNAGRKVYLPTPAEIAEACRQIQAEWSDEEESKRRAWSPAEWTVPQVGFPEGSSEI